MQIEHPEWKKKFYLKSTVSKTFDKVTSTEHHKLQKKSLCPMMRFVCTKYLNKILSPGLSRIKIPSNGIQANN